MEVTHTFKLIPNIMFMGMYYWSLTVTLSCEYLPYLQLGLHSLKDIAVTKPWKDFHYFLKSSIIFFSLNFKKNLNSY